MKRIMNIYESCRISVRLALVGFTLIAIGFLIQNENVNIFYTFRNSFILLFAEGSLKLGQTIVINLPLIFMLNIVCKRANSTFPVILGMVGYFAYLITTTIFAPTNLASTAYSSGLGINSIINTSFGSRYPLETGLIGSFIVAYITRFSFIRSRHRSTLSILGFLSMDSAGYVYNIVLCTLAGIATAYVYPFVFSYIQFAIQYIAEDLMDPYRMGLYGILDRSLSLIGLGTVIRQPFWYTSLGGSFQTIAGQSIVGDVNIYNYVKDIVSSYSGAGRFITPYYVINFFIIPAIIISYFVSLTDKESKIKMFGMIVGLTLLSIVCGNPYVVELFLLFTSPMLLVGYWLDIGLLFYVFTKMRIYMGSSITSNTITTAMPGSFPDYIINIRNINYAPIMYKIFIVGIVFFVITFAMSTFYYRYLAFDATKTGKTTDFASKIIEAVGGHENISIASSGFLTLCVHLHDQEKINISMIQSLNIRRVMETKDGINIECGSSAGMIAKRINYLVAHSK